MTSSPKKIERICPNVLVVAQSAVLVRVVQEVLASMGIRGHVEPCVKAACDKAAQGNWDLVLVHAQQAAPAMELLQASKTHRPERPVVLIGPGDVPAVVSAVRQGCDEYLIEAGAAELRKALESMLPNHNVPLAACAEEETRCLYQIAGRSEKFIETIRLARKVAPTSVPVMITGESGTGKELISYLIHRQSNRSRGPYVRVNCAALSETLLESELFGHERGAFTGAHAQRKGRFERADGGTLLLDEISETGPRLQAELLRVLEQQDFERVGGNEMVQVNVRIICTTNKNLIKEVEAGRFRRDLYYRLAGIVLTATPLRERADDLEVLVWHFVNMYAREVRRHITSLDESMLELFRSCRWPGNVRQLRNVVRTALVLGAGSTLSLDECPQVVQELADCPIASEPAGQPAQAPAGPASQSATSLSLQELERRAILEALQRSQRNQAKAARLLGITDRTLREKLRRYRQDGQLETVGDLVW